MPTTENSRPTLGTIHSRKFSSAGFTMVEMVAVIVVMGILSISLSGIVGLSMESHLTTVDRVEMVDSGRFVMERMSRELRSALPGSVRVRASGDDQCIEFVPIITAATYKNNDLPTVVGSTTFQVVNFDYDSDGSHSVAVATSTSDSVYNSGQNYRVGLNRVDDVDGNNLRQVTLDSSHTFAEESPTRRMYIIHRPASFCLVGTALYRYSGYAFNSTQPMPPSGGVLLGEGVESNSDPFTYQAGSLTRNALIQIHLVLEKNGEKVPFSHEIHFPNVM